MEAEALKAFAQEGSILSTASGRLYAAAGPRKWISCPSAFTWYFPDFFLTDSKPYFTQQSIDLSLTESCAAQEKLTWSTGDFEPFTQSWSALNHLDKIVPYAAFHAAGKIEPLVVLKHAMAYHQNTPGTSLYAFWGPDGGMIGVTPELLCALKNHQLQTMACAGTGKKGEDLLSDPKLMMEHEWVIKGITQALHPFGSVTSGTTRVRDFGRLSHLITEMTCAIKRERPFNALISSLHPTPALGAFPQDQGKSWLQMFNQRVPRGRFGAPVGYIDAATGEGECYVAIRNVQWSGKRASILCGAGVTRESILEKEREEISAKFKAVREILGL